ncbi:LysR substrate-binding domain-containing protein [Lipingzhangella sp. LS1_29]|uniref:LysR substrate-binding domain-containing protein n=1 Tax=Lipingzhangella rawalii TaxID=2055835 RepID=A0ABU2H2E1_9ACTN|nr:LysR substrate-binding domain-containing protein [Lipingzhangella rawalii]MDS1269162.1 LysR substrate-binding domain-containing protein [Lipingzhangella rawalii]
MDVTRLRLLVELERLGTMAAVAEVTGMSTSAVSKHLAVLERETQVRLLVPEGRRVRLTPAGQRLVEHAVGILERIEAAQAELQGDTTPTGVVRLVSFVSAATAIALPAMRQLRVDHPAVDVRLIDLEPEPALAALLSGTADLGIVYEYSLVPRTVPERLNRTVLGDEPLYLAEPARSESPAAQGRQATRARLRSLAKAAWITNSQGSDEDELVQRICVTAGFTPLIRHRLDNLDLHLDLIGAGLGVGILPQLGLPDGGEPPPETRLTPLGALGGVRRVFLVARGGEWSWPPIRTVARCLRQSATRVLASPESDSSAH